MINDSSILTASQKFDIISKNSVEGVIIINDSGIIEEWNDYMVAKSGYSRPEIVGRKVWDVQHSIITNEWKKKYPAETLHKIWLNFFHGLNENEHITKEGQFQSRNNEIVLTEDIICRIRLQDKDYLYVIQRDRGVSKKIENEEVLISIVSYQLKSLISNLLEFSELYNKEGRKFRIDKFLTFIRQVISSSEHTIKLMENLLIFLSVQKDGLELRPEKTNIKKIIGDVLEEFNDSAASKNIELNFDKRPAVYGTADINVLQIILRNLIDNALKFTNENGRVDLVASRKKNFVQIMVSDNGVGIEHETKKKIFMSYSGLSTLGTLGEKGSGLGLLLSRILVEKHGGKIWVESERNKGSKFIFTIPVISSDT